MELLEHKAQIGTDCVGGFVIHTIGGLDAKQILEAKLSLLTAYTKVQANILQPKKDKQGAVFKNGHSYKYADLNSVIAAIQEASKGIDTAYIQQPVMDGGKSGVHNYILNSKGAIMDFGAYLLDVSSPRPMDAGGALTYSRRYSISSLFGIASEEDTDAQEYQYKPEFISPNQIAGLTIMYDGKRTDLSTVYAKALAGDTLAKQVIKDKGNSVNTKIAIRSINSVYEFNKKLVDLEKQEKKKIQEEDQKAENEKQDQINNAAANIIDPPYTETAEFKKKLDKEPKKDPFDEAMKKVHEN